MYHGTTSYTVDCPRPLWKEYKRLRAEEEEQNLNDALVEDVAKALREAGDGDLDDEAAALVTEVLGPDGA